MAEIATITTTLEHLLTKILSEEWRAQGHEMTGSLTDDIEYVVRQEKDKLTLSGMIYFYGNIIAAGTKPSRIPFSGTKRRGQGGGGVSKYIEALQKYAQARMNIRGEKESLSVAFAIAKTQKKEGMPTSGSYRYSSTGKRRGWIEDALRRHEDELLEVISEMSFNRLSALFDAQLAKWQADIDELKQSA